jgi:L-alanine-DL-glutamate epimerase-like enolase superfamily enzyme
MPLREPYTIAYETIDSTVNIFLTIHTDNGIRGHGCAAPDLEVTGETPTSVITLFHEKVEPLLKGENPYQVAFHMQRIREERLHSPSLWAMVDMALYDLLAKRAGLSLYQILGGYRRSIPTSITIGILSVEETLERAKAFIQQGFFILKIKGGASLDVDVERLFKLREHFGEDIILRFDANQGYSVDQAVSFVEKTRDCKLEILEQPTPKNEWKDLGRVTDETHLPVMADESLLSLKDAFRIAQNGLADMINIKLMKVGGILSAMHINSVAKAAGMEAMVGCMDESALGIAAGLHFALALPNVEYADLDGHLDLVGDPAVGCFTISKGVLYPRDIPGLGFTG